MMKRKPASISSNSGLTLLELLVGTMLLAMGAYVSTSVFSYVSSTYKSMGSTKSLKSIVDGTASILSDAIKQNWLALGTATCVPQKAALAISGFGGSQYSVSFLDSAHLNVLVPTTLSNGNTNPLRTSINSFIAGSAGSAASQCAAVGSSVAGAALVNQFLCRCAASITPYGTLQPAETSSTTRTGFYSCVTITLNNSLANTEVSPLFQSGTLLVESNYGVVNAGTTSPLSCLTLAGSMPAFSQGTFTYNYLWFNSATPTSTNSSTIPYLSLAGALVRQ